MVLLSESDDLKPDIARNSGIGRLGERKYTNSSEMIEPANARASLRVLDIEEIKSVPRVPMSHPFVEPLIGASYWITPPFWTASDLENKLREYQCYNNENRSHSGWAGGIPMETRGSKVVDINDYRWKKYCRGLFQLPLAA